MDKHCLILVAGAMSAAWTGPAAAVIAVAGALTINASATLTGDGTDDASDTVPLVLTGGFAEANAVASRARGDTGAYAFGRSDAYTSPTYGNVELDRQITLIEANGTTLGASFDGIGGAPDWTYTFRAEKAGSFTIDYDVFAVGNPAGLRGWAIGWDGGGGGLDLRDPADPTARGRFARSIAKGMTYTVTLRNDASVTTTASGIRDGRMIGTFAYTVAEDYVPEPATWALMIAGFGLVGTAMRRQSPPIAPVSRATRRG